jgi:hypothetical protein
MTPVIPSAAPAPNRREGRDLQVRCMNRRDAIKAAGLLAGGVLVASSGILDARELEPARAAGVLSSADQTLIEEIADTLLPTTPASPGARAARVGATINLILTDCYKTADQQRAISGLEAFRAAVRERRGAEFRSLPRRDREAVLREIDTVARKDPTHYFNLVRELSLGAYFSSEIGMTKALRYIQTPGRWVGCMPLKPGQPAWG